MTVTVAHIAGVPFEEWVTPLLATGGSLVFGLRAAFRRVREVPRREPSATPEPAPHP